MQIWNIITMLSFLFSILYTNFNLQSSQESNSRFTAEQLTKCNVSININKQNLVSAICWVDCTNTGGASGSPCRGPKETVLVTEKKACHDCIHKCSLNLNQHNEKSAEQFCRNDNCANVCSQGIQHMWHRCHDECEGVRKQCIAQFIT